ncbi:GNAT family N-acetyltransferase [Kribbella sp. DT2]|uniref:GNAT family N-acetyltransferase n=1 Tax=Kribbella sp. DT2 TaxID=3393427 RepID=UPI003CF2708A
MRFPDDVPVLTDGPVTLRAHTAADIGPAYETCQDPEMQRWTTIPVPYLQEHAVSFLTEQIPANWADGSSYAWAIQYDGRYAGTIDLRDGRGGVGEVGFAAAPWARGNGVMTRAVKLVVRYAFDRLGWSRVIWRAYVGNWGSRRVAWKAGFRSLVTMPQEGLQRGVRRDEWVASVTPDDDLEPQGHWWDIPVIESNGVRLRPLVPTDAERVMAACNDERTKLWLAGLPSPYGLDDAHGFIEGRISWAADGDGVSWAIADPETDELLGNVSAFDLRNRNDPTIAEIGYWGHPDARGRGVMSAAVGLAIKHAFTPLDDGGLGRRRLVLYAAAPNTASAHVAEVNGFVRTGLARSASARRDGTYEDLISFDLLATEHPDYRKLLENVAD